MKKYIIVFSVFAVLAVSASTNSRILSSIERDVQQNMQSFNDVSRSLDITDLSRAITSRDGQALKTALQDVMELNELVNNQLNAAIQLWNMYLDSVKLPSMETYLLGQVINSLITTLRALTLRSSVDQAMILSLVKKHFNGAVKRHFSGDDEDPSDFGHLVDARDIHVQSRWRSLRQE